MTGLGVAVGPVAGGELLEHFWWGSVFLALVPVALIAAVLTAIVVPEPRIAGAPRVDLPGLLTAVCFRRDPCLYDHRGTPAGMGLSVGTGRFCGRGDCRRPVRPGRAPHRASHARPLRVRVAGLLGRQRLGDGRVLRPVRFYLCNYAVLPCWGRIRQEFPREVLYPGDLQKIPNCRPAQVLRSLARQLVGL